MASDDFAARVAVVATLAEPVRRDLYLFVAGQAEPVGRDLAAAGVGVARHVAKFHLDRLVEEGLLETEFKRLSGRTGPGAGRPAKLYRRAAGEVSVSLPDRRYDLAGRLMARAIKDSVRDGSSVVDALSSAASEFGATIGEEARETAGGRSTPQAARTAACAALAEHGYEPDVDGDTITMHNCPFHALAQEYPALVCDMNLALISAFTGRLGGSLTPRLDPGDDRCCVVVT